MKTKSSLPKIKEGFALISTLSIVVLLALIAIGLLSLSSVSIRKTSTNSHKTAQDNAKLAVFQALARLQETAGPDTRITAPGDTINPDFPRQLTYVGRSWEGSDTDADGLPIAPEYDKKLVRGMTREVNPSAPETDRFLGWLVSNDNNENADTPPDIMNGSIPLLDTGTLGDTATPADGVHLDPEELFDNAGNLVGTFAWHIQGNNSRALIQFDESPSPVRPDEWSEHLATLTSADSEHFNIDEAPILNNTFSHESLSLATENYDPSFYHDLTHYSYGLFTNVATGGWKRDLSLFSEKYENASRNYVPWGTPLPAGTDFSVFNLDLENEFSTRLTTAGGGYLYPWATQPSPNIGHHMSMSWAALAEYTALYKTLDMSRGFPSYSISNYDGELYQDPDRYNIVEPLLSKFEMIYFHGGGPVANNSNLYHPLVGHKPIFTYFNPYNVSIDTTGFNSEQIVLSHVASGDSNNSYTNRRSFPFAFEYDTTNLSGITQMNRLHAVNNTSRNVVGILDEIGHRVFIDCGFIPPERLSSDSDGNSLTDFLIDPIYKPGEIKLMGTNSREFGNGIEANIFSRREITNLAGGVGRANFLPSSWNVRGFDNSAARFAALRGGVIINNIGTISASTPMGASVIYNPGDTGTELEFSVKFARATPDLVNDTNNRPTTVPAREKVITTRLPMTTRDSQLPLPPVTNNPTVQEVDIVNGNIVPFYLMKFGLRELASSNTPTKGYINNKQLIPLNFTTENIVDRDLYHSPFDWTFKNLDSINDPEVPTVPITSDTGSSQGFFTSDIDPSTFSGISTDPNLGVNQWVITELPTQPILSLCELQHFDPAFLNYHYPLVSNALGNSHAAPFIAPDEVLVAGTDGMDHSYIFNTLMWDDWFISSLSPETENYTVSGRDLTTVFQDFLKNENSLSTDQVTLSPLLRNRSVRSKAILSEQEAAEKVAEYRNGETSWRNVASEFTVKGMFNINSTSMEAWSALLKSYKKNTIVEQVIDPAQDGAVPTAVDIAPELAPISRFTLGNELESADQLDPTLVTNPQEWTDVMIETLAELIVEEIRERGPFLSLAEFMNRQLSDERDLAVAGCVEAALIHLSEISDVNGNPVTALNPFSEILTAYSEPDHVITADQAQAVESYNPFPEAAEGHVLYGTPGWPRQADVLRPIASILSARDDTFTIRAYGSNVNSAGDVDAEAWCEATVQRTSEYVDPTNDDIDDGRSPNGLTEINELFGRKFKIVSFRWLAKEDV